MMQEEEKQQKKEIFFGEKQKGNEPLIEIIFDTSTQEYIIGDVIAEIPMHVQEIEKKDVELAQTGGAKQIKEKSVKMGL